MLVANKLRALNCSFLSIKSSPQSYSKQQQKPNYLFLLFLTSTHSGLNPTSLILLTTTALACTISGWAFTLRSKLYIPSSLNIDLILWHTQLNVCAENVKSWIKSWVFPFTFQAYTLPHTLNFMCVSLFKFHIWILEQF